MIWIGFGKREAQNQFKLNLKIEMCTANLQNIIYRGELKGTGGRAILIDIIVREFSQFNQSLPMSSIYYLVKINEMLDPN